MKLEKDWTNETGIFFEHDIVIGDFTYLVIFGYHVNGGWICVPNHAWGCEASDSVYEVQFNTDKLVGSGASPEVAEQIARYIDIWLQENQEEVTKIRMKAHDRMMERFHDQMMKNLQGGKTSEKF